MGEGLKLVGSLVGSLVGKPVGGALNRFGGVDRWGWASEVRINTWEWEVVGGGGVGGRRRSGQVFALLYTYTYIHRHAHSSSSYPGPSFRICCPRPTPFPPQYQITRSNKNAFVYKQEMFVNCEFPQTVDRTGTKKLTLFLSPNDKTN